MLTIRMSTSGKSKDFDSYRIKMIDQPTALDDALRKLHGIASCVVRVCDTKQTPETPISFAYNDSLNGIKPGGPLWPNHVMKREVVITDLTREQIRGLLSHEQLNVSLQIRCRNIQCHLSKSEKDLRLIGFQVLDTDFETSRSLLANFLKPHSSEAGAIVTSVSENNPLVKTELEGKEQVAVQWGFSPYSDWPTPVLEARIDMRMSRDVEARPALVKWHDWLLSALEEKDEWSGDLSVYSKRGVDYPGIRTICQNHGTDWSIFVQHGYEEGFNPLIRPDQVGEYGMHYPVLRYDAKEGLRMSGAFVNVVHKRYGSYFEINSFEGVERIESCFKTLQKHVPQLRKASLERWSGDPNHRWEE